MPEEVEILINADPWNPEIDVVIKQGDNIGSSVVMVPISSRSMTIVPTLKVSRNSMQKLFNEMWSQGFRPADGTGNSGHVGAIEYHLEDMRKLVFKGK